MADTEDPGSCDLPTESPKFNCLGYAKAKIIILGNLIGLVLYLFDVCTDAYAADQHHTNSNYMWFVLTLTSIVLPIVIACIGAIFIIINTDKCSGLVKLLLIPSLIVCSPIVPFSVLVWKFVDSIRHYPDNDVADDEDLDDTTLLATVIKFVESITQSFPQAALQMYISFQVLNNGDMDELESWQWLTITASLLALAYYISSSDAFIIIAELPIIAKAGVFVFVLLIAASRIFVSCIYSTIHLVLFFVPISVEIGAYIILGCNHFCCYGYEDKGKCCWAFIVILGSLSNLCFAIGGCFLPTLPMFLPITITALIIAVICWLAICIFTYLIYRDKFYSCIDLLPTLN